MDVQNEQSNASQPTEPEIPASASLPTQQSQQLAKRSPWMRLAAGLIVLLLVTVIAGGYFIWNAPRAYAREYLEQVGSKLDLLQVDMQFYLGGFDELSASVNESKQAFYEISTTQDYASAKIDVDEDIAAIEHTLSLVAETRATKDQYNDVPAEEFGALNAALDAYLDAIDKAMSILLAHQQFQKTLLAATGDELSEALLELENQVAKGYIKLPEELPFFENMVELADAAVVRYRAVEEIPATEQAIYELKLEYHSQLAQTLRAIYDELNTDGGADVDTVVAYFIELNQYAANKNDEVSAGARAYVDESEILAHLEESELQMTSIISEVTTLKDKYGGDVALIEQG